MSDNKSTPKSPLNDKEPNSFKTVTESSTTSPAARSTMTTPGSGSTGSTSASSGGMTRSSSATGAASTSGGGSGSEKTAAEMLDETKRAASDEAASLSDKAKAQAGELAEKAHEMADSKFDEVKENASGRIEETARHIRNAGHEFGDDSYQAQAADYLASNLTRAADMVRGQNLSTLTSDLTQFARRNPALFLGGAAMLGFAAARLMKASERGGSSGRDYDYDYTRDSRFDAPPTGVSGTPYDRPGSTSSYGRTPSGAGTGASSTTGTGLGTAPGSATGTGTGSVAGTTGGRPSGTGSVG